MARRLSTDWQVNIMAASIFQGPIDSNGVKSVGQAGGCGLTCWIHLVSANEPHCTASVESAG